MCKSLIEYGGDWQGLLNGGDGGGDSDGDNDGKSGGNVDSSNDKSHIVGKSTPYAQ